MSTRTLSLPKGSLIRPAILAGFVAGIITDAYLILGGHAPFPGIYQFIASTVVGKIAFTSPSFIALGVVMHIVISIVWAVLYLYVWPLVNSLKNWVLGAVVWGIIVDVAMNLILAATGNANPLGLAPIVMGLITHIVFFALPITWFLSRREQRSA